MSVIVKVLPGKITTGNEEQQKKLFIRELLKTSGFQPGGLERNLNLPPGTVTGALHGSVKDVDKIAELVYKALGRIGTGWKKALQRNHQARQNDLLK
jgi:hypothetical protein